MSSSPSIAIITPVHNAEKYIRETLDSVMKQTYTNWTLLAVNDHSSDSSVSILEEYANLDSRIKILHSSKAGAAEARNIALRNCDSDFIAFIDADDLWHKDKIKKQIAFMQDNKIDFSYTPYDYVDEKTRPLNLRREVPETINYKSSIKGCRIGCLTVIYRRKAAPLVQTADLKKRNDDALWITIFKEIETGYRINEIIAFYRKSQNSISSGSKFKIIKFHYQLYRKNENLNPLSAVYYTVRNVFVYLDVRRNWEHPIK